MGSNLLDIEMPRNYNRDIEQKRSDLATSIYNQSLSIGYNPKKEALTKAKMQVDSSKKKSAQNRVAMRKQTAKKK